MIRLTAEGGNPPAPLLAPFLLAIPNIVIAPLAVGGLYLLARGNLPPPHPPQPTAAKA